MSYIRVLHLFVKVMLYGRYTITSRRTGIVISIRGELPGLGPLTINLNINAKTNAIDVNNILT